ncbi:hypothetical protein [Stackebrandtia nassauensis]|uniref:Uncharacterized protein n=1 Tax=Stackebrandtia nassauensis (strain DSM 44728 / CIP 108903 / NRRL B-16338 / NBRC 102104 / LLR-40K-21) TaxID=446470 RepID=D3PVT7_STANL|nr:hypothetical protein [Stackebrandtia nassauensis]ADD45058.1 hypothetical protein Snas_5426 [Stackebrandtia nassauensis DSM 44728]
MVAFLTNRSLHRSGAKERASGRSLDACIDFVGISLHYLTVTQEYIVELASVPNTPGGEEGAGLTDDIPTMRRNISSLDKEYLIAAVRAESFAPTQSVFSFIHTAQECQSEMKDLLNKSWSRNPPVDWDATRRGVAMRHDAAAQDMTEQLRLYGAQHTYLDSFPGKSSRPESEIERTPPT